MVLERNSVRLFFRRGLKKKDEWRASHENQPVAARGEGVLPDRSAEGIAEVRNGRLLLNGKPYFFIGLNRYSLAHEPLDLVDKDLKAASQMGVKVIRFWAFDTHRKGEPAVTFSRQNDDPDGMIRRMEELFALGDKYGIKFVPVLSDSWDWGYPREDPRFQRDPEWYRSGYRKDFIPYTEKVVSHFKGRPEILFWEVQNEPHSPDADGLREFLGETTETVKRLDPDHPVASGISGGMHAGEWGAGWFKVNMLPSNDLATYHDYYGPVPLRGYLLASKVLGKPLYVGEWGAWDGPPPPEAVAQLQERLSLFSCSNPQYAGFIIWDYDSPYPGLDPDTPFGKTIRENAVRLEALQEKCSRAYELSQAAGGIFFDLGLLALYLYGQKAQEKHPYKAQALKGIAMTLHTLGLSREMQRFIPPGFSDLLSPLSSTVPSLVVTAAGLTPSILPFLAFFLALRGGQAGQRGPGESIPSTGSRMRRLARACALSSFLVRGGIPILRSLAGAAWPLAAAGFLGLTLPLFAVPGLLLQGREAVSVVRDPARSRKAKILELGRLAVSASSLPATALLFSSPGAPLLAVAFYLGSSLGSVGLEYLRDRIGRNSMANS